MRARSDSFERMFPRFVKWIAIGALLAAAAVFSCTIADFQFLLELMIYMGGIVLFRQVRMPVPVVLMSG